MYKQYRTNHDVWHVGNGCSWFGGSISYNTYTAHAFDYHLNRFRIYTIFELKIADGLSIKLFCLQNKPTQIDNYEGTKQRQHFSSHIYREMRNNGTTIQYQTLQKQFYKFAIQ